jgi:RNA polymerase sigma-70 factor (ECF subfamily)
VRAADVDETALWRRSAGGDAEAFASVFDLHHDRVFHQALRLVETWEEAEDVAAAAFLELWRRRRDVRIVGGSVLPWLLVTTANLARNSARARRRYRDFLARLPREREQRSPDAAEAALDGVAAAIDPRLRAALRALPGKDLHLLLLIAFADQTLADAAAVLNISPSAAKNRLHRARARLRERLECPEAVPSAQEASR